MNHFGKTAADSLAKIRDTKPLIHNITNYVVMNSTANALLAMGASPVMAHALNEVEEMATLAQALVLNIGTLSDPWVTAMLKAGKTANVKEIPVVLDPVGAGATSFRTESTKRILQEVDIRVLRGNASEVMSLQDVQASTRGVDAIHSVDDAAEAARSLAQRLQTTLAITGPVDFVTDGDRVVRVENGHPLMSYVTGTGCMATAAIAAFSAVDDDPLTGTASALAFFGLAGETAAKNADAPGSFMVELMDALYKITPDQLASGFRIAEA